MRRRNRRIIPALRDLGVARHEADERRRQTHAAQRNEERVLAAHDVADAAEDERSERRMRKPAVKVPTVLMSALPAAPAAKKLDRQERGQAPEDVEVVPLDDIPTAAAMTTRRRSLVERLGAVIAPPSRVWVYG